MSPVVRLVLSRLGLVVASSAYLLGLSFVWIEVSWPAAVVAGAGGFALTVVLSVEQRRRRS